MTDPRYPGWDHPTIDYHSTLPADPDSCWPGCPHSSYCVLPPQPRPDGVPGPALVLALVVGVVVVIVGGFLWWATR